MIHYDPWWNAAAQMQATDRAYRIGQKRPVFVYNLIASASVEERMLGLRQKKRNLADNILGDSGALSTLSEDDVADLFAPLESRTVTGAAPDESSAQRPYGNPPIDDDDDNALAL